MILFLGKSLLKTSIDTDYARVFIFIGCIADVTLMIGSIQPDYVL